VHNIDIFDTNYKYNRRKLRAALVDELELILADTGQKGGHSGKIKCIRFRGDQRLKIRQWLIDEQICNDAFPVTVSEVRYFTPKEQITSELLHFETVGIMI
jgi:hypothetical protein